MFNDIIVENFSLTWVMYMVIRYFKCAPLHGLFAPLHKVTSLSATVAPPRRSSLLQNAGLVSSHRTNSQESLSSIGSTSSVSRSGGRMRLGVMSLSAHVCQC